MRAVVGLGSVFFRHEALPTLIQSSCALHVFFRHAALFVSIRCFSTSSFVASLRCCNSRFYMRRPSGLGCFVGEGSELRVRDSRSRVYGLAFVELVKRARLINTDWKRVLDQAVGLMAFSVSNLLGLT